MPVYSTESNAAFYESHKIGEVDNADGIGEIGNYCLR